jgi:hypothetical protein
MWRRDVGGGELILIDGVFAPGESTSISSGLVCIRGTAGLSFTPWATHDIELFLIFCFYRE